MVYRLLNIVLTSNHKLNYWLMDNKSRTFVVGKPMPFKDYCFATAQQAKAVVDFVPDMDLEIIPMDDSHHFELPKYKDESVYKILFPAPYLKWGLREKFQLETGELLFEADISYVDLLQKDYGLSEFITFEGDTPRGCSPPDDFPPLNMVFFDFEWDDRKSVIKDSKVEGFVKYDVCRLLSAAFTDAQTGESKFLIHKDEKTLLKMIKEEMYKYQVVDAWNGIEADKKMKHRWDMHDIPFTWDRFIFLDAMSIAFTLDADETHFLISLDEFAFRHLGKEKIKHQWGYYEAYQNYVSGKDRHLEEYNIRDTELMYDLYKKLGFESIILGLGYNPNICILPSRITYSRKPSIQATMRMSLDHYGKRIVWKSRSSIPTKDGYVGAIVFEPIGGVHKNVVGVDLASLYNNIIQTWNISPEQLVLNNAEARVPLADQEGNYTHSYDRFDHEGLMPRVLREFEKDRNKYKKLKSQSTGDDYKLYDTIQAGLKVVLLSVTGGLGARGSTAAKSQGDDIADQDDDKLSKNGARSFYSWHCASDFTAFARQIIKEAARIAEEHYDRRVVYGDTDSIYVEADDGIMEVEAAKAFMFMLIDSINARYKEMMDNWNIPEENRKIVMEAQGWYSPFVLFPEAKKRYFARLRYNAENDEIIDPNTVEIYAKGVEFVKNSIPPFIRDFQKEVYTKILLGQSYSEIDKHVRDTKKEFFDGVYDDQCIFQRKLRKPLDDYNTDGIHVRLAKEIRARSGSFQEFSTMFYYIWAVDPMTSKAIGRDIGDYDTSYSTKMARSGREYVWSRRINTWLNRVMDLLPNDIQKDLSEWF